MKFIQFPFLLPYVISALISLSVALFAWQRRTVAGAWQLALLATSQAAWTFGFIFELQSETLATKLFWDNMQFVAALLWPLAFLAFSKAYVDRPFKRPFRTWTLVTLPFLLFCVLMVTDQFHGLIRPSVSLIPGEPFDALTYEFATAVWLTILYAYALIFYGLFLLLATYMRAQALYRHQMLMVVIGSLIPLVGVLLTLVGITVTFQRDTTPFTFAISNLFIAWGLFHYRLFDIVPIARDAVLMG